uniref:Uncharacterized protein n=1 Tax=Rhipicephalus pulchellus TaxID=72859 RepID=L7LZ19_RHIPC
MLLFDYHIISIIITFVSFFWLLYFATEFQCVYYWIFLSFFLRFLFNVCTIGYFLSFFAFLFFVVAVPLLAVFHLLFLVNHY